MLDSEDGKSNNPYQQDDNGNIKVLIYNDAQTGKMLDSKASGIENGSFFRSFFAKQATNTNTKTMVESKLQTAADTMDLKKSTIGFDNVVESNLREIKKGSMVRRRSTKIDRNSRASGMPQNNHLSKNTAAGTKDSIMLKEEVFNQGLNVVVDQEKFNDEFLQGCYQTHMPKRESVFEKKQRIFVNGKGHDFDVNDIIFDLSTTHYFAQENLTKKIRDIRLTQKDCYVCQKLLDQNSFRQCGFCSNFCCLECNYKKMEFPKC